MKITVTIHFTYGPDAARGRTTLTVNAQTRLQALRHPHTLHAMDTLRDAGYEPTGVSTRHPEDQPDPTNQPATPDAPFFTEQTSKP